MKNIAIVLLGMLVVTSCTKSGKPLSLALDVYLHPESGSSADVLLQTAIRDRFTEAKLDSIYARVLDLHVVLNGTVKNDTVKNQAATIAANTQVDVREGASSKTLKAADVKNLIDTAP